MANIDEVLEEAASAPFEVRYRMIRDYLGDMSSAQFFRGMTMVRDTEKARMLKFRAESGDRGAQIALDQWINGDPDAKMEEKRLGLVGLWKEQGNEFARDLLLVLGATEAAEGDEEEIEAAQIPAPDVGYLEQQLEDERKKRQELEARLAELEALKRDLEQGRK